VAEHSQTNYLNGTHITDSSP